MHFSPTELEMIIDAIDSYTSLSDERAMHYAHLHERLQLAVDEANELETFVSDCGDSCKL